MGIPFHELLLISYYSNVLLHDYSCQLLRYSNTVTTAVVIYSGINILTSHLFPTLLYHHHPSHGKDGQHIAYMVLYNTSLILQYIAWYSSYTVWLLKGFDVEICHVIFLVFKNLMLTIVINTQQSFRTEHQLLKSMHVYVYAVLIQLIPIHWYVTILALMLIELI